MPLLESILQQFPFVILNVHSENGSEFINKTVAQLLDRLLIEQTKSRPRKSGDNGLVETKGRGRFPASGGVAVAVWRLRESAFRSAPVDAVPCRKMIGLLLLFLLLHFNGCGQAHLRGQQP